MNHVSGWLMALVVAACAGTGGPSSTDLPTGPTPTTRTSPSATLTPTATLAATPEPPITSPGVRGYHALAGLGPELPGVVLHGGERTIPPAGGVPLTDLWRSGPDGSWSLASEGVSVAVGDAIAFDAQSGAVVVFGLVGAAWERPQVETWVYAVESATWTRQPGAPPKDVHRAAYDSTSDRIVVYTGAGQTWAYDVDSDAWQEMHPVAPPPPRTWSAMTYDVAADRVLLFGGYAGLARPDLADLWAYDLDTDTWTEMHPTAAPSGRHYGAMAYEPTTARTILYGGTNVSEVSNGETWAYQYATDTWTLLADAGGPGPLAWHAMAADAGDGSIVLYGGGFDRKHFTGAVWRFDPTTDTWALD